MPIDRGGIYWHDFGAAGGRKQAGMRPVVVIQADYINQIAGYGLTMVIPLSTRERRIATWVAIEPSQANGLSAKSYAICTQVYTINKGELEAKTGQLSAEDFDRVIRGIQIALDIVPGWPRDP
jgi:mRNA interferase MazF